MSSADPSKFMVTADSSSSTINIERNWGGGVPIFTKGPQNHNENGDPGSPISWDPQNFMIPDRRKGIPPNK